VSASAAMETPALVVPASGESSQAGGGHQRHPGTLTAHDSYRHEAFLWNGEGEFLAGTVPFIREGLKAAQPVMVAVTSPHIDLLRAALGMAADLVRFVDMAELGRNPALIIARWREFVEEEAVSGQPVRGIGEPIWSGRRPAEVAECQLHEALLNIAIEPHTPLWLLCPYDVLALAPDVITGAQRTHPVLVEVENRRGSTLYGGSHQVGTMFEADLPEVDVDASRRKFGRDDLLAVREEVVAHALGAGLSAARSAEIALAVHEVATNSVRHGSGERVFLIWLEKDSLVCEFRDSGRITDPMIGRRTPAWDDEGGRGLWIANQLCDLVQVRSSAAGTTTRISTWI
jgi:anti-sigma regulatory factor (Ser/Thr protein kinase)